MTKPTGAIKLFYFPAKEVGSTRHRVQLTGDGVVSDDSKPLPRQVQEAIKHIVATIFSAQNALRDLAPEQRWAGMGNLLGDYGEYIALDNYNLTKAPGGADGYDATTADGMKVQIKANHSSATIGFRGEADLLLVLKIESNAEWRELYYGPFKPVKEKATYSKRDNKYMIPIAKLGEIAKHELVGTDARRRP